jgi:hypothetical protein
MAAKAFDGMTFKVACCSTILQILIMTNTPWTLVFHSGTLEEMILPAIFISNVNCFAKKTIGWGAPSCLELFCRA